VFLISGNLEVDPDCCNQEWVLKNSLTRKWLKKLCARIPYKRLSRFSRHFASPKFGLFGRELDFFNTHRPFHSKSRSKILPGIPSLRFLALQVLLNTVQFIHAVLVHMDNLENSPSRQQFVVVLCPSDSTVGSIGNLLSS